MSDSLAGMDRVVQLSEDYLARLRKGESPTIDEYIARHPELEKPIRDLFPSLRMIENLAPQEVREAAVDELPDRIGDYQITREIGRGGMGVVYEAEQQSLRRRVALKVLPRHTVGRATALQRFQLEAQAAARLHHENIVPIYDVGEADGVWYYAMQLISGNGLDQVMDELRRLGTGDVKADQLTDKSARTIAETIMGGEPGLPEAETPTQHVSDSTMDEALTGTDDYRCTLPDHSDLNDSTASRYRYFRGVARIGIQVARALAYAHEQGIVHRDIKPSNLLLDYRANVWITDFGLAKAQGEDLTRTGDVVGTLRYMAPERFRGGSDARSDVYGLGITLFELLVMRPAFVGEDRIELIRQVTHDHPGKPRSIDPRIPRELETIVLKSIEKEPTARYASALELAEDLERYLDNKPLRARPAGIVERSWRWYRRNWIVATLGSSLIAILTVCCIVVFMSLQYARQSLQLAMDEVDRTTRVLHSAEHVIDEFVRAAETDSSLTIAQKKGFLEAAIRHLDEFVQYGEGNPRILAQLGGVYHRVGVLKSLIGDWQGAIEPLERQRQILLELIETDPSESGYRTELAGANANLGAAYQSLGHEQQAIGYYQEAIDALDNVPVRKVAVVDRTYRANITGNLGLLLRSSGDPVGAIEKHRAEIESREQLCLQATDAQRLEQRHRLARARLHLGNAELDLGHVVAAQQHYEQAEEVLSALHDHAQGGSYYVAALCAVRIQMAHTEIELGRLDEALAEAESAMALASDPSRAPVFALAVIHDQLASALFARGDTQRALEHHRIAAQSVNQKLRFERVELLVRCADAHQAHGNGQIAIDKYREAISVCELIQEEGRFNLRAAHWLGLAEGGLGNMLTRRHEFEEAGMLLNSAIQRHTLLAEQHADLPRFSVALARHWGNQATLLAAMDNLPAAETAANRSLELTTQAVNLYPDTASYFTKHVAAQLLAAAIQHQLKNADDALELYQQGIDAWVERFGEAPPADINLATLLGGSYCNAGFILTAQQNHERALRFALRAEFILEDVQLRHEYNHLVGRYLDNTQKLRERIDVD